MERDEAIFHSFNTLWYEEDLRDEDEDIPNAVMYGTIRNTAEITQDCCGQVDANEVVMLKRDDSTYSIYARNKDGQRVGYLKRDLARILSPLKDRRQIYWKGVAPYGSRNRTQPTLAIDVTIWGEKVGKIGTLKKLSALNEKLKVSVNSNESEEAIKRGISYRPDQGHITFNESFKNLKEEGLALDSLFETLTESDKMAILEPPKSISTPLYLHQKQALAWMTEREKGEQLPPFWEHKDGKFYNNVTFFKQDFKPPSVRGGILADDMGLGKTLVMIALIMSDREEEEEEEEAMQTGNDVIEMEVEDTSQNNQNAESDQDQDVVFVGEEKIEVIVIDDDGSDEDPPSSPSSVIVIDYDGSEEDPPSSPSSVIDIESEEENESGGEDYKEEEESEDDDDEDYEEEEEDDDDEDYEEEDDEDYEEEDDDDEEDDDYEDYEEEDDDDDDKDYEEDDDDDIESLISNEDFQTPLDPYKESISTLIVAPLSVLNVWQMQLREHVHKRFRLKILLFHRDNKKRYRCPLNKKDVVITTYETLLKDFQGAQMLQRVYWFRIVLDEGHKIKNPLALRSEAICNLKSQRKWIISGTPIQNKVDDLWSMIKFLGIDTFKEYRWWQQAIERPLQYGDNSAKRRIYKLMSSIALRRTKETELNGKKLIELPQKEVRIEYIEFSEEERQIYDRRYQYYRSQLSRLMERDRMDRSIILKKICCGLLLLRQYCCHPSLIEHRKDFNNHLSHYNSPDDHNYIQRLACFLRSPSNECSICLHTPSSAVISSCEHVFCKTCIFPAMSQNLRMCPNCRSEIRPEFFHEIPQGQMALRMAKPELDDWKASSKTAALIKDLIKLRDEDPRIKCLVVSEFTKLLDLLQQPLRKLNFNFVRFDGTMSPSARRSCIEDFSNQEENSPTVMLLSLKAGGEGISLVAASKIFLLTPYWNPAAEDQCFDRCYRPGQTKNVSITKYIIKDSIEDKIMTIQEQKRKLTDCAFNSKKKSSNSILNELKTLFC